ncbi:MAG: hypothetical protein PHV02_08135 [Rhodocyclaceae bacterium]|nr:hypothetical protein [Rhodocyclaceae bacterium]
MKFHLEYEDNKLFISKTKWDELKKNKPPVAFASVVAAAKEIISRGGAFVVYCDSDTAIMRRCDRMSELDNEIGVETAT